MLRTYDVFEVLPSGDLIWKAKIDGHENAVKKLQELAETQETQGRNSKSAKSGTGGSFPIFLSPSFTTCRLHFP